MQRIIQILVPPVFGMLFYAVHQYAGSPNAEPTIFWTDYVYLGLLSLVLFQSVKKAERIPVHRLLSLLLTIHLLTWIILQFHYTYYIYYYRGHLCNLLELGIPLFILHHYLKNNRKWILVSLASLLTVVVIIHIVLELLLAHPAELISIQPGVLINFTNFTSATLIGLAGIAASLLAIYKLWIRPVVRTISFRTHMILLGVFIDFVIALIRSVFIFVRYHSQELYQMIMVLELLVPCIWLGGFLLPAQKGNPYKRMFIWLEFVAVAQISIMVTLFIPQEHLLFKSIFIAASLIIIQAMLLMFFFIHQIDRDRWRKSSELMTLSERLMCIMCNVHDAIVITDESGKILETNDEAAALLTIPTAIPATELNFHEMLDTLPDGTECASHGSTGETILRTPGGRAIPVTINRAKISGRRHDFLVYALRDQTVLNLERDQKRKLQTQVERLQKMEIMANLVNRIAHDVNNFLSGIIGHAYALIRQSPPGSITRERAEAIKTIGDRLGDLIAQMRSTSHAEARHPQAYSVNDGIREVIHFLRGSQRPRIQIQSDLQPELPPIHIDPLEFIRCVMNISTNAITAMSGEGTLSFKSRSVTRETAGMLIPQTLPIHSGAYIKIDIADSGPGIPPEIGDRIFDPFFTTGADSGGTGLGLNIVLNIVSSNYGVVDFESRMGAGTTFHILFPAIDPVNSNALDRPVPPPSTRILLLLNHRETREFIQRCLSSFHCKSEIIDRYTPLPEDILHGLVVLIASPEDILQSEINLDELLKNQRQFRMICVGDARDLVRGPMKNIWNLPEPLNVSSFIAVLKSALN